MRELSGGQRDLNSKLKKQGAGFEINSLDDAQRVIDLAREVLEEKIKNGENFENFLKRDPENDDNIKKNFDTRTYSIVVDVDGKEIKIGHVGVNYDTDEGGKKTAFLADVGVFVKSLRKGLGLGRLLLEKVGIDAKKMGCEFIMAAAINNRSDLQEHPCFFYQKLGYKIESGYSEEEIRRAVEDGDILPVYVIKYLDK